jgi:hypothetical protein
MGAELTEENGLTVTADMIGAAIREAALWADPQTPISSFPAEAWEAVYIAMARLGCCRMTS